MVFYEFFSEYIRFLEDFLMYWLTHEGLLCTHLSRYPGWFRKVVEDT